MSRKLNDLSDQFRPYAIELLARLVEAGIPVIIVTTRRTVEEQTKAVADGNSWTMHSRHLTGDAIDVAPYETYALHDDDKVNWDATDPVWKRIGEIGQACGLKWGVIKNGRQVDPGHFELHT